MQLSTIKRRLIVLGAMLPWLLLAVSVFTMARGSAQAASGAGDRVVSMDRQSQAFLMPGGVLFDVEVTKTVSPDPTVVAGQQLIFTVYVTNNGPETADAIGVPLSDTLPSEVSFVSVNVSAPDAAATCDHSGETSGGIVTCNLGALAPNETAIVAITTTVDPSTPGGTVITNQAISQPVPEQETNEGNNTSNETRTTVVTPTRTPKPTRTPIPTPVPRPVGGYGEPLSTAQLLGPWMILVAGVVMAAVAVVLLAKRVVS